MDKRWELGKDSVTFFSLSGLNFLDFFSSFSPSICLVNMGSAALNLSSKLTASRTFTHGHTKDTSRLTCASFAWCISTKIWHFLPSRSPECSFTDADSRYFAFSPAASPCWRSESLTQPRQVGFPEGDCPGDAETWQPPERTYLGDPAAAHTNTHRGVQWFSDTEVSHTSWRGLYSFHVPL